MTRDQVSAAIAKRAWQDPAFHKAVLTDPSKIYEEETGKPLPPGLTIKVLEDTANTIHFVLPPKPPNAGELSDAELEQVAGGVVPAIVSAAAISMFTFAIGGGIAVELAPANPANW